MHTQKQIIALLKSKAYSHRELADHFKTSRQAIEYHIKVLGSRLEVEERKVIDRDTGVSRKVKYYRWKATF